MLTCTLECQGGSRWRQRKTKSGQWGICIYCQTKFFFFLFFFFIICICFVKLISYLLRTCSERDMLEAGIVLLCKSSSNCCGHSCGIWDVVCWYIGYLVFWVVYLAYKKWYFAWCCSAKAPQIVAATPVVFGMLFVDILGIWYFECCICYVGWGYLTWCCSAKAPQIVVATPVVFRTLFFLLVHWIFDILSAVFGM